MQCAIEVSQAFQKVVGGPPRSRKSDHHAEKTIKYEAGCRHVGEPFSKAGVKTGLKAGKNEWETPTGAMFASKVEGQNRFHWMRDYTEHANDKKQLHTETVV